MHAEIAIITGSGLSSLSSILDSPSSYDYAEIGLECPTAPTHKGKLFVGEIGGKSVAVFAGRLHPYEGLSFQDTVATVRKAAEIGAKTLIVTNAAGGVNFDYISGDLMLISDHIKLVKDTPLVGSDFIDMTDAYSPRLREIAKEVDNKVKEGVYFYMHGPQFETPAEIRAIRALGGDAVGMSTVAEVIQARSLGIDVLGISCITNYAAGVCEEGLSSHDVEKVAQKSSERMCALIKGVIESC
jgi:inosine guanosine and xanthosine phosphorylase family